MDIRDKRIKGKKFAEQWRQIKEARREQLKENRRLMLEQKKKDKSVFRRLSRKIHSLFPTRTQQNRLEEVKLKNIVERMRSKKDTQAMNPSPIYCDTSVFPQDIVSAFGAVQSAMNSFNSMPSQVRAYFHNSPTQMMEFVQNPENRECCMEMGLIAKPKPVRKPVGSPVDSDQPPDTVAGASPASGGSGKNQGNKE
jgi:hypothetical protein